MTPAKAGVASLLADPEAVAEAADSEADEPDEDRMVVVDPLAP